MYSCKRTFGSRVVDNESLHDGQNQTSIHASRFGEMYGHLDLWQLGQLQLA